MFQVPPASSQAVTYLEGVFPAEALVAEGAGVRLHRQVDPLVPLEVVVPVEGLRAHIALERPLLRGRLAVAPVHAHMGPVGAVVAVSRHGHPRDQRHLPARVANVGHDGAHAARHRVVGVARPRRARRPVAHRRRHARQRRALCHRGEPARRRGRRGGRGLRRRGLRRVRRIRALPLCGRRRVGRVRRRRRPKVSRCRGRGRRRLRGGALRAEDGVLQL